MARLRSLEYGGVWIHRIMADPDPGDARLNGAYRGQLPVRQLAAGISGSDLGAPRVFPAPGQLWRRGPVMVRVLAVSAKLVRFLELGAAGNERSIRLCDFVRLSRPVASS